MRWAHLKVMLGASTADLDLRDLSIDRVTLETGGSALAIHLPRAGAVTLQISGGSVTVHLPVGGAVQVGNEMKLGEVNVKAAGLMSDEPAQHWATPDFVEGPDALTVVIKGGLGTVNVK